MKEFLKRNKYNFLIVFLVGLFVYSIRIFFKTVSIDTEVLINDPNSLLDSWMSIGRFGLVGIKKLFNLLPINITLTNILTFIIFYLSVIVWIFNIEKWKKNKNANLVFGLVLITSPIFVEQFGFTLQSFEVSIAFLLFAIGFYFMQKYLETNKLFCTIKILYAIIPIIFFTFTFTCYQAFIFLYITICVFDYFIKYKGKMDYKLIAKYIVIFIISAVLYFGITEILTNILNIQKTSYLLEQISWNKGSFFGVLLKTVVVNVTTTSIPMGIIFDFILAFIFIILSKFLLSKYKIKENKMFYLVYIFLFVSPFISGILKGSVEIYRAKFALAFFIALILFYLFNFVESEKMKKVLKYFIIFVIVEQAIFSFSLYFIDYQRYKSDIQIGEKMNEVISKMDITKPVVFVGKKEYKDFLLTGEVLGHSFYEWDAEEVYGVNYRATGFLKIININYDNPSLEEYEKAKEESINMPIWPDEGSIVEKDDMIIVKLGEIEVKAGN